MTDRYANLYNNFGNLIQSGFTTTEALEALAENEPRSIATGLRKGVVCVQQGGSLEEALTIANIFDPWEIRVLVAGEKSGHLPEICKSLSTTREQRQQRIHELIYRSVYPIVLVHLAILGPSLGTLVSQGAQAYWRTVLPTLGILYALFLVPWGLITILRQSDNLSLALDHVLLRIPFLGQCLIKLELAKSITILQNCYTAGITLREATEQIIPITRNRVLKQSFQDIHQYLVEGQTLGKALQHQKWFPGYVKSMLSSGELSGKLEEQLKKTQSHLEHESQASLQTLISVLCTCIFIFAAIVVAYKIVQFYSGYMQQIMNLRQKP